MEKYGVVSCPECNSADCTPAPSREATDVGQLEEQGDRDLQKMAEAARLGTHVRESYCCASCGHGFQAIRH